MILPYYMRVYAYLILGMVILRVQIEVPFFLLALQFLLGLCISGLILFCSIVCHSIGRLFCTVGVHPTRCKVNYWEWKLKLKSVLPFFWNSFCCYCLKKKFLSFLKKGSYLFSKKSFCLYIFSRSLRKAVIQRSISKLSYL